MRWVRANLATGSRLALFALTVQIALSFGHNHLDGLRHAANGLAAAATPSTPSAPPQPPVGDADDYCAICATIHLSATSFLPQPPQLPVALLSRPVEHFDCVAGISFSPRRAPFQSRAPPLA
jgi:hypothetical protein